MNLYWVEAWSGLIWLRTGTGGGRLWIRQWSVEYHKMQAIFCIYIYTHIYKTFSTTGVTWWHPVGPNYFVYVNNRPIYANKSVVIDRYVILSQNWKEFNPTHNTHLCENINSNSMERNSCRAANISLASQEIPWILWYSTLYCRIHKHPQPVPILNHINPVQASTHWRFILILSSQLFLGFPSGSFRQVSP